MSDELLLCPCCSGRARRINENSAWYAIKCFSCGLQTNWHPQPEGADKAWNTRPDSKPYKFKTYWDFARSFGNEFPGREGTFNAGREHKEG